MISVISLGKDDEQEKQLVRNRTESRDLLKAGRGGKHAIRLGVTC